MKVKISELRKGFDKVLNHMIDRGIDEVELDHDYYWHIREEARYDPYVKPKEFDMGQLSDDLDESLRVLNEEDNPMSFSLVWLSSISKAIGEKVVS